MENTRKVQQYTCGYFDDEFYNVSNTVTELTYSRLYSEAKREINRYLKKIGREDFIEKINIIYDALVPYRANYSSYIVNVLADAYCGYIDIDICKTLFGHSLNTGMFHSAEIILKYFRLLTKEELGTVNIEFMEFLYEFYSAQKNKQKYYDKYNVVPLYEKAKNVSVRFNESREIQTIVTKTELEEKLVRNKLENNKGISFLKNANGDITTFYIKYKNNTDEVKARSYLIKAKVELQKENYSEALILLYKALGLAGCFNSYILSYIAESYNGLGNEEKRDFINELVYIIEARDYKELIEEERYDYIVYSRDNYFYGINNIEAIISELMASYDYESIFAKYNLSEIDQAYSLVLTARECYKTCQYDKGDYCINLVSTNFQDEELESLIEEVKTNKNLYHHIRSLDYKDEIRKLIKTEA